MTSNKLANDKVEVKAVNVSNVKISEKVVIPPCWINYVAAVCNVVQGDHLLIESLENDIPGVIIANMLTENSLRVSIRLMNVTE